MRGKWYNYSIDYIITDFNMQLRKREISLPGFSWVLHDEPGIFLVHDFIL